MDHWTPETPTVTRIGSPAAASLRVYFPAGATVSAAVTSHRRNRNGVSKTTIMVTAVTTSDSGTGHGIGNVSGLVCDVTGYGRSLDHPTYATTSGVTVQGYGNPEHAVSALVSDLARALYGSSTVLRSHVL